MKYRLKVHNRFYLRANLINHFETRTFCCIFANKIYLMILRQFSSNQPYVLFLLPVVNLLVFIPALFGITAPVEPMRFPFDLLNYQLVENLWLSCFLAWLFISGGATLFNWVYNRHEFHSGPTFVPALVYSMVFTGIYLTNYNLTFLIAQLFFVVGSNRLLEVFRQKTALDPYFRAGFWFGLSALLFPPYVLLLPTLMVSVLFTRGVNLREYIVPIVGFLFPFAYVWSLQYIVKGNWEFYLFYRQFSLNIPKFWEIHEYSLLGFFGMNLLAMVSSWRTLMFTGDRSSNKNRNSKFIVFFLNLSTGGSLVLFVLMFRDMPLETFGMGMIYALSYYYTNYRTSLLAPVYFYGTMLAAFYLLVESTGLIPVFKW